MLYIFLLDSPLGNALFLLACIIKNNIYVLSISMFMAEARRVSSKNVSLLSLPIPIGKRREVSERYTGTSVNLL